MTGEVALRPYAASDEDASVELWRRSWQQAYPDIDFTARLAWWRERWRTELVPACSITIAETEGRIVGFVTVDPGTGYLDQIVVAPEAWGSAVAAALLDAAKHFAHKHLTDKQLAPGLDLHVNRDNRRAIRFYEKHGFTVSGQDVNPRSGAPTVKMSWRA